MEEAFQSDGLFPNAGAADFRARRNCFRAGQLSCRSTNGSPQFERWFFLISRTVVAAALFVAARVRLELSYVKDKYAFLFDNKDDPSNLCKVLAPSTLTC